MSEKVRDERAADVKAATEPNESRRHLGRWTVVGAVGAAALAWGAPALVRATAPDCSVVMRADEPGVHAIYLPDGQRRYGDAFKTDEGTRVFIGSNPLGGGEIIDFSQQQIADGVPSEYEVGDGIKLELRVDKDGAVRTSC